MQGQYLIFNNACGAFLSSDSLNAFCSSVQRLTLRWCIATWGQISFITPFSVHKRNEISGSIVLSAEI